MTLQELSEIVGVQVEDHPFDIGYWLRVAEQPRPRNRDEREGWDCADDEMQEEKT